MRLALWCLALLMLLPAALHAAAVPAGVEPAIRLNEFMAGPARDWDGSGTFSSRDDEWVEIVNAGSTEESLEGFLITDGDSLPRYALSGVLAPGAHLMISGKQSHAWEQATGHPAFGFSLANSGDAVLLWHVAGAETTLVDGYTYKSHEAAADRAVGRSPDLLGVWALFDSLDPYTGATPPAGNGCAPSPGAPNVCAPTPVRPESWGRMKALYR